MDTMQKNQKSGDGKNGKNTVMNGTAASAKTKQNEI